MQYFIDITTKETEDGIPQLDTVAMLANDGRVVVVTATDPAAGDTLSKFCDSETYGLPEFWVYDAGIWPVVQASIGTVPALPSEYRDLKTIAVDSGSPTLPARREGAALGAQWTQQIWSFLGHYRGKELTQGAEEAESASQ